jgi:ATP-dependent RNA helicase RhlB
VRAIREAIRCWSWLSTRELVVQIEEEAQVLSEYLDFKFATVYGGVGYNRQEDELAANPDFIIATPAVSWTLCRAGRSTVDVLRIW